MNSVESKIRQAVESIKGLTIGSWHPITVTHNGVTLNFLANIKRVVRNGRDKSAIHLMHIKKGRMLSYMPVQSIVQYYKLDKNNNLKEEGLPGTPTELTLSMWQRVFSH